MAARPATPGLEGLYRAPPAAAVRGPSGATYHSTSLGCLRPHHWPRRLAISLIEHGAFEPLIALTIAANCVTMAWESPLEPDDTWKAHFIQVARHAHSSSSPRERAARSLRPLAFTALAPTALADAAPVA